MDDEPEVLDTTPAGRGRRRARLHRWTAGWWVVVVVCAAVVIGSGVGLARSDQGRPVPVVVFTALALIAALTALVATIARAQAGSTLGEDELADPAPDRSTDDS